MLLAEACPILSEGLIRDRIARSRLFGNQLVNAIECHAAVIADDAATAVGIGKTCDDVGGTRSADPWRVNIEDGFVMGLAVLGEDLLDVFVNFLASFLDGCFNHAPSAIWHHCTLEWDIGLETDDHVVIFANVASRECIDVGRNLCIDVVDAALTLHVEILVGESIPNLQGLLRRTGQEGCIAFVRRVILLDKVADIDVIGPISGGETSPCFLGRGLNVRSGALHC